MRRSFFVSLALFLILFSTAEALTLTTNLSLDSSGPSVSSLQEFLKGTGDFTHPRITGYYGTVTVSAVQKYQCRVLKLCSGTPSTNGYGNVGPRTRASMNAGGGVVPPTPTTTTAPTSTLTPPNITQNLSFGITSEEVRQLQLFLKATGDYTHPTINGFYGTATEDAVKRYQARKGVVSSGTPQTTGYGSVGPSTRTAIAGDSVTQSQPSASTGATLSITATPTLISRGGTATLTWLSDAASCTVSGTGVSTTGTKGSAQTAQLFANTLYLFTCMNQRGERSQRSVTVYVEGQTQTNTQTPTYTAGSPTAVLHTSPPQVTSGSSAMLSWYTTNASSCTASGGWTGSKAPEGSELISNITQSLNFILSCTGLNGNATNANASISLLTPQTPNQPTYTQSSYQQGQQYAEGSYYGQGTYGPSYAQSSYYTQSSYYSQGTYAPGGGVSAWNVTYTPPAMSGPTTLYVPDDATLVTLSAWHAGVCAGQRYELRLDNNRDYIIRHKPGAPVLTRPLGVFGGRNVRMVGLAIDMQTQSGCTIGSHPKIPGGIALYVQQVATSFIEGAHIKLNGHAADCIVGRNPSNVMGATAFAQRDYIIQNTRCEGWEGEDAVHGDIFQQQGAWTSPGEVTRNLFFENVTGYSSQEGIIHEANDNDYEYGVKKFVARRFNFVWDPVYGYDDSNDSAEGSGGPPAIVAVEGARSGNLANITLEDYYVNHNNNDPSGAVFMTQWGNDGATSWGYRSYGVGNIPGIHHGLPPGGDFAPANKVGLNYVSPHDNAASATSASPQTTTPPASPAITFTASPSSVTSGNSATLSWSVQNATACTASDGWSGGKGTSGSQSVSPTASTAYSITCTGAGGSVKKTVTVTLSAPVYTQGGYYSQGSYAPSGGGSSGSSPGVARWPQYANSGATANGTTINVSCGGGSGDTTTVQNAFNQVQSGGTVRINGMCGVGSSGLTLTNKSNVTIKGSGRGSGFSALAQPATQADYGLGPVMIEITDCNHCTIRDLDFKINKFSTGAFVLRDVDYSLVENNFFNWGTPTAQDSGNSHAMLATASQHFSPNQNNVIRNNEFDGGCCNANEHWQRAIFAVNEHGLLIELNTFTNQTHTNIGSNNVLGIKILNNLMHDSSYAAIKLDMTDYFFNDNNNANTNTRSYILNNVIHHMAEGIQIAIFANLEIRNNISVNNHYGLAIVNPMVSNVLAENNVLCGWGSGGGNTGSIWNQTVNGAGSIEQGTNIVVRNNEESNTNCERYGTPAAPAGAGNY
jgi:peptidoglycan hydrolase-like protein with peptidoglycan-binding domain